MLKVNEKLDLYRAIDGLRVSNVGNFIPTKSRGRFRLPIFRGRPRADVREKLRDHALKLASTYAKDDHGLSVKEFITSLRTDLVFEYELRCSDQDSYGKPVRLDPLTIIWIIRICVIVAQFFMERNAATYCWLPDSSPIYNIDYLAEWQRTAINEAFSA